MSENSHRRPAGDRNGGTLLQDADCSPSSLTSHETQVSPGVSPLTGPDTHDSTLASRARLAAAILSDDKERAARIVRELNRILNGGPAEPSPFLALRDYYTGAPVLLRKDAIERVEAAPCPRGLETLVYIRGVPEPTRVFEQADDVACELGAFADRCRMCLRAMPGAGQFGGFCDRCIAETERAAGR